MTQNSIKAAISFTSAMLWGLMSVFLFGIQDIALARTCGTAGISKPMFVPVQYDTGTQEQKIYNGSYALLIGSSKYADAADWSDLSSVPEEIDDLANELASQGFYVEMLCDAPARGPGSLADIKAFLGHYAVPGNRVLIFMSGHGWVDAPKPTGYFAGTDSPRAPSAGARQKGIGSEQVIDLAKSAHAKHLLIVIDACYSAAIFTRKSPSYVNASSSIVDFDDVSQDARQFITVGSEGQEAPSPSLFAPALVLGLAGYADQGGGGVLRASQLGVWLRKIVANSTADGTTPRWGYVPTTPGQIVTGGGDMIFRYDPRKEVSVRRGLKSPGASYLNLAMPGAERMRAELSHETVAVAREQTVEWPNARYQVTYYEKAGDGDRVLAALDKSGIPYAATRTILPANGVTNGLACHPEAPVSVVKAAARALILNGVPIRVIDRATKYVDQRRYMIQALEYKRVETAHFRNLTLEDVDELTDCPQNFVKKP